MYDHYNALVVRRNSDLKDVALFPARWTENAWRIALILHASQYGAKSHLHKLDANTCRAATKIIDWIGEDQLQMLEFGRKDALQVRVDRLVQIIRQKGENGEIKVRDLKNNHGFDDS
jgi:hypothetical protein